MPQLRPDSIFQEWLFTPEEDIQSRLLTPLLILRLNTIYSELIKEAAHSLPPEDPALLRGYSLARAEIGGKMALITELFQSHKEATDFLSKNPITNTVMSQNSDLQNLESRAAANVHNSNTSL